MKEVRRLESLSGAKEYNMQRNDRDDVAIVVSKRTWLMLEKFRETAVASNYDKLLGDIIKKHLTHQMRAAKGIVVSDPELEWEEEINARYAEELQDAEFLLLEADNLLNKEDDKLCASQIYFDLQWYLMRGDREKLLACYLRAKRAHESEMPWMRSSKIINDKDALI